MSDALFSRALFGCLCLAFVGLLTIPLHAFGFITTEHWTWAAGTCIYLSLVGILAIMLSLLWDSP